MLADNYRQDLLQKIKKELSITEHVWANCYIGLFEKWAALTQSLPASEAHHHAFQGGLLNHSLECSLNALRLRRGYVLPANEPPENNSLKSERYSYAVCLCSLMHDSGKLLTDIDIVHGSPESYGIWSPWSGPIAENEAYAFKFRIGRKHNHHEWAGASLLPLVVPEIGLKWLLEDKEMLTYLFAQMSGKQSLSGAIGEIVRKADKASVARAMGGKESSVTEPTSQGQPTVALHDQLLMAIRYLFHEGRLTINKPGAAGWIKDGTAWLVSKATVEAATTHLFSEGIRTVPKNVARVFDILAEHDLAETTGEGKAVWKCKVHDANRDWHQELTMLKFKVESIWPNETPADLNGTVTPIISASEVKKMAEEALRNEPHTPSFSTSQSSLNEMQPELDLPPPYPAESIPQFNGSVAEMNIIPSPQDQQSTSSVEGKSVALQKEIGEDFIQWVKQGVADKSIKINDPKAMVHIVNGKVLLVSPAIFQKYVRNPTVQIKLARGGGVSKKDDKKVQAGLQKLLLHEKSPSGRNLVQCEVRGQRRTSTVNGYLLKSPEIIFGNSQIPSNNPFLTLLS